jgi:O-succinylbenzoate synthase
MSAPLVAVELVELKLPLVAPFETSFGRVHHREPILVRLEDKDGVSGWGEAPVAARPHYNAETTVTAWHILEEFLAKLVLGRSFEDLAQIARALSPVRGHNMAKAAIEFAFADLLAKRRGEPIAAVFGSKPRPVEVGVSLGIPEDRKLDRFVGTVERFVEAGYRRVKLKLAPGWDVEPVLAVRAAFPGLRLMADANGAYSVAEAAVLARLDPARLLLLEQPLDPEDLVDHANLARTLSTPIALDESLPTLGAVRAAIALDACDVLNVKPGRLGGPTAAMAALVAAHAKGKGAFLGGMLESGVGRAANIALAALEGFTVEPDLSATDRYYVEDIAEPAFVLDRGRSTIAPAPGPGIGVTVIEERLKKYALRRKVIREG